MVERFLAECADLVDEVERKALSLASGGHGGGAEGLESVNDIFRAVHTIKGNSGFFGYGRLESACMDSSPDSTRPARANRR